MAAALMIAVHGLNAQHHTRLNLNKPGREEWFSGLGLGIFIHWSFDVQLGMVISHTAVGASEDYLDRYFNELPGTFDPGHFEPAKWARAASMAGMKYMVFTAKHHSGFCMFDTETTPFNVMNTAFATDATREILDAFRKEGLAVGLYFSPDDFWFMYQRKREIGRMKKGAMPSENPDLIEYDKAQIRELMTQYGTIDIVFIDGVDVAANAELAKVCWELNEDVVVTRGAIQTPEQTVPDKPLPSPWESCITLGEQWQYRPTNEHYKTAGEVIGKIIEIRSKGGNLLLNIGPDKEGRFPPEQSGPLNELALWHFINREALENVEPWHVIREGEAWFLKKKGQDTLYVFITGEPIPFGSRREMLLKSVRTTPDTKASVLGHDNKTLEYRPDVNGATRVEQTGEGVQLSVFRGQRIYNDRKWPNPVVVRLEHVLKAPSSPGG